jgi:hypothetical protein
MLAQVMSVLQQPAHKGSLVLQGMRDLLQETVAAAAPAAATAHNSSQQQLQQKQQHVTGALLVCELRHCTCPVSDNLDFVVLT